MRVTTTKSKNSESFYINYAYIDKNGKSTSRIYKKLGTLRDLKEMLGTDDRDEVMKWAREQARIATEQHKAESESIQVTLSPKNLISINEQCSFNCGYLFLQKICTDLRIDNICRNIRVKLFTASPFSITAVSFQWPYFSTRLMYSSARFTPPLKAVCPSMTRIFRWSR